MPPLTGVTSRRRPPSPLVNIALTVAAITLSGMAYAASHGFRGLSASLAGCFALTVIAICIAENAKLRQVPNAAQAATSALRTTTMLSVLVYGWAAAALMVIYKVTNLIWQHGWQYSLALALVAVGLAIYVRALGHAGHWTTLPKAIDGAIRLAIVHGAVSAGVLIWIIASGKLATLRGDWAANYIFSAVTATIAAISAVAVITHRALKSR